jgi:parallel beta-helix repeat protein
MKRLHATIAIVLMVLICAVCSAARTLVVPKDFDEIQAALDKAAGGDTVFVTNGIYEEKLVMRDSIVLLGEDIRKTVIHGNWSKPVIHAADFASVQNLTVKGGGTGILCDNKRMTIDHVFVTENRQTGIHCLISLPTIRNCIITRNKWTGIYCESVLSIRGGFEHNVVAENGYCGIMLAGKSNLLLANNVVCNNRQFGLYLSPEARKTRIVHNCIFGNRNAFNNLAVVNSSNLPSDPGFTPVVPNTYDYFVFDAPHLTGQGTDGSSIGLTSQSPEPGIGK